MAGMKAEVVAARQLFLYGNGDGRRVIGVQALCEATGVHEQTIWKYMPKWQKELEEILANSSDVSLALHLSAETLATNKRLNQKLEDQVNQIIWELEKHDDIAADLREWARETGDLEFSMRLLETYLRTCGSKATLRGQLLAYQKAWTNAVGVEGMKDVSLTAAKELSKGRAKMKLKSEESEAGVKNVGPRLGGVFERPGNVPRPDSTGPGED